MKKYFYFATAALLTFASCANDDFVGTGQDQPANGTGAIRFASATSGQTRADHVGADAASLLNKTFTVGGYKGGTIGAKSSVVTTTVFDHYTVNWGQNTAATTESNTADWEYVGQTVNGYATANGISSQTIKYWDFSQGQYDFIAYSPTDATVVHDAMADGKLYITKITPATATSSTGGAYTVAGATAELGKFYLADLVTVPQANYGQEVNIKFRNITTKVRVGLYETVPGYSVKDVKFYTSDTDNAQSAGTSATLYSSTANMPKKGTYTVYYPVVNSTTLDATHLASDMNKAHVAFAASGDQDSYQSYGALDLVRAQASTQETNGKYLGTASNAATYATSSTTKPYTTVLPNEDATSLTLRCDYTLVSDDGSKETITVHGAKAVVPAIYCQWKSNYAYTYIFKISDKTNGSTEKLGGSKEGLLPITFDAATVETEDGIQETLTTVSTPSITTYQQGTVITANDEYKAGDIYVMVQDGATLKSDLDSKGQLYTVDVTNMKANNTLSEATVHDALTIGATTSGTTTTGRNGIALTTATSDATITAIPGADGNNITVTAKTAAKFAATASTTYAYVYETTSGAATTTYTNTAVVLSGSTAPGDWNATSNVYYSDFECTTPVNSAYAAGTYYQKVSNTNKTYAVKIIKVVA